MVIAPFTEPIVPGEPVVQVEVSWFPPVPRVLTIGSWVDDPISGDFVAGAPGVDGVTTMESLQEARPSEKARAVLTVMVSANPSWLGEKATLSVAMEAEGTRASNSTGDERTTVLLPATSVPSSRNR
jgi:hypothetical protein